MQRARSYIVIFALVGLIANVAMQASQSAVVSLRVLPGWPVFARGGSTFSPVLIRQPDGGGVVFHNENGTFPGTPPRVFARSSVGSVLSGWPSPSVGSSFFGLAVVPTLRGEARRVFFSGFQVKGVELEGQTVGEWPLPASPGRFRAPPSLVDLDGDGELEVLAVMEADLDPATPQGFAFAWRQTGVLFPGWPVELPKLATLGQGGNFVIAPPSGSDLDGDGVPEVIIADQGGLVVVYDSFGHLIDGWPQDFSLNASMPLEFAVVPLGDGSSGIAVGTGVAPGRRSSLMLFDSNGALVSGWPRVLQGFQVLGVSAGDLDGDGVPELVAGDSDKLWAFHLDGTAVAGWPVEVVGDVNPSQPLVADLSGDGLPDVLLPVFTGFSWGIFAWSGQGVSLGDVQPIKSGESILQTLTLGDLNADGLLDLGVATESGTSGRVYVYTLDVPLDESTMHWPTHAHDYQRTSTWTPPTRVFGGRGTAAPPRVESTEPPGMITMHLHVAEEAPVEAGLEVTALGGVKIAPISARVLAQPPLTAPTALGTIASSPVELGPALVDGSGSAVQFPDSTTGGVSSRGRGSVAASDESSSRRRPGGGLRGEKVSSQHQIPMGPPVSLRPEFNVIAQVNGRALMDAFEVAREAHPELLLNDDELRQWLDTDIIPEIPTGEARPLWMTIESPRVGVKKLKAHVAVNVVVNP